MGSITIYNSELEKKWKYKDHNYTQDVCLVSFISSTLGVEITSLADDYLYFTDKDGTEVCTIMGNSIYINDEHPDEKIVYLLVGYCAYQNYKYTLEVS